MRYRRFLPLAGFVVVSACGPEPAAVSPSPEVTVTELDGSGQNALRGSTLLWPLRLKVELLGAPIAGAQVVWQPSAGSVVIGSSITDASGVATARWTLGSTPGPMTLSASVVGVEAPPVVFTATALPLITLSADPATDGQAGIVGTPLERPLRVRVLWEGAPRAGVTVHWSTAAGTLPSVSLTDGAGYASAMWTLATRADTCHALARVDGAEAPVEFTAQALPAPPGSIVTVRGDGQTLPANYPAFQALWVTATDSYGNFATGQPIEWTIVSGPAAFLIKPVVIGAQGLSVAHVEPTGEPGDVVVRAAGAGGAFAEFTLTALPREPLVVLDPNEGFVSGVNGTRPAVDTIPAGTTMTWVLYPFDYDDHSIVPVGTPALAGGTFPYGSLSRVSVTVAEPGTYQYGDPLFGWKGTLVVQ